MVTPLTVTPAWICAYLDALREGSEHGAAATKATKACGPQGKEFARCRIRIGTLTVPVAGGGNALKRRDADPVISEHGKWRREHLGAWQAAYGRTPWFEHLMPDIAAVYDGSEGLRLEEFNVRLLQVALRWLDPAATGPLPARLDSVREATRAATDPSLSIFDALFRLGKEAVFAL